MTLHCQLGCVLSVDRIVYRGTFPPCLVVLPSDPVYLPVPGATKMQLRLVGGAAAPDAAPSAQRAAALAHAAMAAFVRAAAAEATSIAWSCEQHATSAAVGSPSFQLLQGADAYGAAAAAAAYYAPQLTSHAPHEATPGMFLLRDWLSYCHLHMVLCLQLLRSVRFCQELKVVLRTWTDRFLSRFVT